MAEESKEKKSEDYQFINEKIVPKKKNKWLKRLETTVFVIFLAVVFGIVSGTVFLLSGDYLQKWLGTEEKRQEVELPKPTVKPKMTMSPTPKPEKTPTVAPTQPPIERITPPITITSGPPETETTGEPDDGALLTEESATKDTTDAYLQMYEAIRQVAENISDAFVTVEVIEQSVDWFKEAYEKRIRTTGLILGNDGIDLLVLIDTEQFTTATSIEVIFGEEVINGLEKEKEALQNSIDQLEKYKDKWSDIAKEHEIKQNEMLAASILGADWESQILSGRLDTLNIFKNEYLSIQDAIKEAAWETAKAQVAAQQYVASNGTSGGDDEVEIKVKTPTRKGQSTTTRDVMLYHDGINKGYVGENLSKDKRLTLLKSVANGNLLSDEVPAILQRGELVLTELQQNNLAKALWQNPIMPDISMPKYDYTKLSNKNDGSFTMTGDINITCPGVTSQEVVGQIHTALQRKFTGMNLKANQKMHRTR